MILFDLTVQMHMCIAYPHELNLPLGKFGLPIFKFKWFNC